MDHVQPMDGCRQDDVRTRRAYKRVENVKELFSPIIYYHLLFFSSNEAHTKWPPTKNEPNDRTRHTRVEWRKETRKKNRNGTGKKEEKKRNEENACRHTHLSIWGYICRSHRSSTSSPLLSLYGCRVACCCCCRHRHRHWHIPIATTYYYCHIAVVTFKYLFRCYSLYLLVRSLVRASTEYQSCARVRNDCNVLTHSQWGSRKKMEKKSQ